jgi:hypothetical protein
VRKRPPLSFPQLLVCISLLCALTGALTLVASHTSPDRRFEQFTSQLFQEEMTGSTLNMHYTIADPKTFGISEYEPVLPIYHSGQPEDSKEHCSDLLHRLDRIDPDRLSPENAYTYRLLHRSLENDLALADFPYYNEPLSPSSGMQSQLPVLLAEYTFRTKRDVTDYLALLDQIDDYFASLLLYEQEKAAAGFFMPACSSEKVRKQCDTIVTTEELAQGTHFLQTTFEDRLSELQKQGLFTPEETASLIETNDRLLATVVQPPYPKGYTLWRLPPMPIPLHPKQLPMLLRAKTTVPTMGSRKGSPCCRTERPTISICCFPRPVPPVPKKNWCRCCLCNFRKSNPQSAIWLPSPLP